MVGSKGDSNVGATSLERLIRRVAPDRSVRSLTEEAGVPDHTLAYWLRPSTRVDRMPSMPQLRRIAACLPGADVVDVSRAFAEEIGLKLNDDLTDTEHELLRLFRQLSPRDQQRVYQIVRVLLEA